MRSSARRQSGQSLLEFALVLPILLLLLIAIINFGEVLAAGLLIQNIARNGARAASLGDTETQVKQQVASDIQGNALLSAIACSSSDNGCPSTNPSIVITPSPNANNATTWSSQTSIQVEVQYGIQLWGPITSAILGNPYLEDESVTMIAE